MASKPIYYVGDYRVTIVRTQDDTSVESFKCSHGLLAARTQAELRIAQLSSSIPDDLSYVIYKCVDNSKYDKWALPPIHE